MNEKVKFPPKNNDYDSDSDEEDNVHTSYLYFCVDHLYFPSIFPIPNTKKYSTAMCYIIIIVFGWKFYIFIHELSQFNKFASSEDAINYERLTHSLTHWEEMHLKMSEETDSVGGFGSCMGCAVHLLRNLIWSDLTWPDVTDHRRALTSLRALTRDSLRRLQRRLPHLPSSPAIKAVLSHIGFFWQLSFYVIQCNICQRYWQYWHWQRQRGSNQLMCQFLFSNNKR